MLARRMPVLYATRTGKDGCKEDDVEKGVKSSDEGDWVMTVCDATRLPYTIRPRRLDKTEGPSPPERLFAPDNASSSSLSIFSNRGMLSSTSETQTIARMHTSSLLMDNFNKSEL
jgi:hypothetical protein